MDNTKIAIIIPVYGVTSFLEDAVKSAIEQNYPGQEIIVVDDGSDAKQASEIARICGKYSEVVLLRQPHAGPACARQFGVQNTSAELILFLDADDILLPGTLPYFAEIMHRNQNAVAAYGRLQNVDRDGNVTDDQIRPPVNHMSSGRNLLYALLEKKFLLYNGTVCIRRQALQALPPQNHALRLGEDWVLWCHLALSGNIIPAGERVVLHYRRHNQNVSSTLLDNPALVFASIEDVFTDRLFIDAIGEKEIKRLHETCIGRMNAYLAIGYAKRSQWHESRYHLAKAGVFIKASA